MQLIVLDEAGAEAVDAIPNGCSNVLALCPRARLHLMRRGIPAESTTVRYHDAHHAVSARESVTARNMTAQALEEIGAPEVLKATLPFLVFNWAAAHSRIQQCLSESGPWYIATAGGLRRFDVFADALEALIRSVIARETLRWTVSPRRGANGVMRLARNVLLRMLRRKMTLVMSATPKMRYGLKQVLLDHGYWVGYFNFQASWRDIVDLASVALGKSAINSTLSIPVYVGESETKQAETVAPFLQKLTETAASHPGLSAFLHSCRADLSALTAALLEYADETRASLLAIRPLAGIFHESNEFMAAGMASAAQIVGAERINVNNNSLPIGDSHTADEILALVAGSRINSLNTDTYLGWSVSTNKNVARIFRNMNILPVRENAYVGVEKEIRQDYVLYASNAPDLYQFYPHIIETSDELHESILAFADALPDDFPVDVVVRLRDKQELGPDQISVRVGLRDRFRICGVEGKFLPQLRKAWLLVSYMSSTVEQALHHRIPVLFWGPTARHVHLPASSEPPTPEARHCMYVCHKPEDLPSMLLAIERSHRGRPLTDEELQGYAWSEDVPTVQDQVLQQLKALKARE